MADVLIDKYRVKVVRQGTTPANPGNVTTDPLPPVNPPGTGDVPPISFLQLTDTPPTYASQALKLVRVNAGETGLEFTTVDVLGTVLTGYTVGSNTSLAATDTILQAFGKVQGQINARVSGSGTSGQVAFWNGTSSISGDNGLLYDRTNARLYSDINLRIYSYTGGTSGQSRAAIEFSGTNQSVRLITASTTWIDILSNGNFRFLNGNSITTSNNGNISLTPNGTGLVMIGSGTPTNLLDVNGTARIRTVSNATGNFVTLSATGVLQQRTAAEVASDIGAATISGLTTNTIIKATSATTIGNTGISEESSTSYLFGSRTSSGSTTPLKVSYGGTFGTNTSGTSGNLKWLLYDDGVSFYGVGMSNGLMEFQVPTNQNFGFYTGGTQRARITGSTGNFQLGAVASSTELLTVFGLGRFSSSNDTKTLSLGSSLGTGTKGSEANIKLAVFDTGGSVYGFGVSSNTFEISTPSTGDIIFYPNRTQSFAVLRTGNVSFANGNNIEIGTGTGTKIGTSNTQKFAFWNATPIVQPLETALANTPNTGDANTDALITALKNVILNTGLARSA